MLVNHAAQRVVPALRALFPERRRGPGHPGLHCGARSRAACSSRRSVGMTTARPSAAAISAWMLLRLATDRAASTTLAPSAARPRATTCAESLAGAGHHRDPAHKSQPCHREALPTQRWSSEINCRLIHNGILRRMAVDRRQHGLSDWTACGRRDPDARILEPSNGL
jgi:hypothetical protein